jgi:Flp pilus assembly protein TadG
MAVEFVVIVPAFALLLLLVSGGGQWINANGQVGTAARDAARAASVARTYGDAQSQALAAAQNDLKNVCQGGAPALTIVPYAAGQPPQALAEDDGGFVAAQEVRVTVTCTVNLSAFGLIGFPSAHAFKADAAAPLDTFVCRSAGC